MSAQVTINSLPAAGPITGTESVPIVQNGVTVQTTTGAIAASPSQTQTFLTVNQEITLPNSRYLSTNGGLSLTDGGPESFYRLSLTGAAGSLQTAAGGIIVKDSGATVVARQMVVSGDGLSVSNADGTGGNPTFQLTGIAAAVASLTGTGMLALTAGGTAVAGRNLLGTTDQINIANGNGALGSPTVSISDDAVLPGTGAVTIPSGTTAQQPLGIDGKIRFNTDIPGFEGYANGSWRAFSLSGGVYSFSAGSTGLTPVAPEIGNVTLGGTLNVSSGGTGANSLTGYVIGNGTSAMTASLTIPTTDLSGTVTNAQIANPQVTFNGITVNLGASGTITAVNPNALTFGTGFTAGSYTGASAQTINLANTAVTAGSYGSASNTLTATVNGQGQLTALAATPIAIANTQVSGLGTMSTQNASAVAITGGSINGTTVGASTASTGRFTTLTITSGTVSSAPITGTDIVNKDYADSIASGINFHAACAYATTADLGTVSYNNGTAGVGATLTKTAPFSTLLIDGHTFIAGEVGFRVLLKNQSNGAYNGVYTVTSIGSGVAGWVLTRATDYDTSGSGTNEVDQGDLMLVLYGTANANTQWTQQTPLPITVGTTALVFIQFGAPVLYTAGTGLNLSPSTTFNISNTGVTAASYGTASQVPTLAINAQGQVTSASNTSIAIAASQVTSGTFSNAFLTNSSVTVNGTAIALGASGTITAANPNALTIGTGLSGTSYTGAAAVTIALANSGVTAATYGSASQVPVFAVDATGRITTVTNTAIAIASGAVSGLAASATTDTTNAANISSGTLPALRLSGSYTGISGVGTITAGTWNASAVTYAYGGTGLTAIPGNGQLAIGNGAGYTLANLTAGTNVSISNTAGGITISATPAAGGTVTSVSGSGGTTGLTLTGGPITTSGTLTLGGTLVVANGGTGAATLTGYVKGTGITAMTASTTIPNTDITGLGTMSTQNASTVAITGGTIEGTSVGATTASTVRGTTITATTQFSGPGTGLTGTAASLTVGSATNASNTAITEDVATAVAVYPTWVTANTGNLPQKTTSTRLSFVPSTGVLSSTSFTGAGTGLTGTATSLSIGGNAATATTATTATNQSGGTVSATTGTFSGITQITNTTASSLYTNGALVVSGGVGVAGRVTVNDILNRITASGNTAWLQQDGTGRTHWYWNTYGGTVPVFTNAGEDASAVSMTATLSGAGGSFFHRSASGVGKIAGDPITWTTTIYSDINTFSWKGYTVLQSNNFGSYAVPLTGGVMTGALTATSFTGAGTGLTGTAASLSIGGNAATATSATSATTATNVAGGVAGNVHYQTGVSTTGFVTNGTAGQVLTSAGSSAPTWSGISGGTF